MSWWNDYPISHGYLTTFLGAGTDSPHYADDIATPFHTPLSFPFGGTVTKADYAPWGGEIFVKTDVPGYGSVQEYIYHLDYIDPAIIAGAHINAGQYVGLSGGQNSGGLHPVSTQWSTGPHTHIGLFTNWITTTDGTRPYGPDITPFLKGLSSIGTTGGGSVLGIPGTNIGIGIPGIDMSQVTSIGVRVGVFVIALIALIGGFYLIAQ